MGDMEEMNPAVSMAGLMGAGLSLAGLQEAQASNANALAKLNEATTAYGLALTEDDLHVLAAHRKEALAVNERIEFGHGILPELVAVFASSPYLEQVTYLQSLLELQDIFYRLKDEVSFPVPDEVLLLAMRAAFDGDTGGSLEALDALQAGDILAAAAQEDEFEPEPGVISSVSEEYHLVNAEGRVYSWDPEEWHDDEFGLGWEGQRWSDDF